VIDDPDALTFNLRYHLKTLIFEGNIFQLTLNYINRDLVAIIIKFGLFRLLGNLQDNDSRDRIDDVLTLDLHSGLLGCLLLAFLLSIRFVIFAFSIFFLCRGAIGARRKFNSLDPSLELSV